MNSGIEAVLAQVQRAMKNYRENEQGSEARAEAARQLKQYTADLKVAARNARLLEVLAEIENELEDEDIAYSPEHKLLSSSLDWEAKAGEPEIEELYKDLENGVQLNNHMLQELDAIAGRNAGLLERTNSRFRHAVMSTSNSCLLGLIIVLVMILALLLKYS